AGIAAARWATQVGWGAATPVPLTRRAGWHRPMSISACLVRRINGGGVRRGLLPAGREREDIHGSEDGGTGPAVRGEGPGCRGDAGEAWRRGLEEGDRGGEMDGGRDRAPSGRGAGGGGRHRDR